METEYIFHAHTHIWTHTFRLLMLVSLRRSRLGNSGESDGLAHVWVGEKDRKRETGESVTRRLSLRAVRFAELINPGK